MSSKLNTILILPRFYLLDARRLVKAVVIVHCDPATSDSVISLPNSDSYINSYDRYVYTYRTFIELMEAPKIIAQDNYSFQSLAIEFEKSTSIELPYLFLIKVSLGLEFNRWVMDSSLLKNKE